MDQETRTRILDTAQELFLRHGFSKVTMNEIAAALGMSKKTLYAHFEGKEELFTAMHAKFHDEMGRRIHALMSDAELDFVDKLLAMLDLSAEFHQRITPEILTDFKRNAPRMQLRADNPITAQLRTVFEGIIREGVETKVFRADINEQLLIMLHIGALQTLTRPEALAELPLNVHQIIREIGRILFFGILTEDGREGFRRKAAIKQSHDDGPQNHRSNQAESRQS
jgi:AcrR family transcriptional regulator